MNAHDEPIRRPDPVRWLWYAIGGRLPVRFSAWVLRDLTCRTWALRHTVRALVQVAPVIAGLMLVIPGSLGVRAAAVVAGLLLGLLYSCAYMHEIAEHRVGQAGYHPGTAAAVRAQAHTEQQREQDERYALTWRPVPAA